MLASQNRGVPLKRPENLVIDARKKVTESMSRRYTFWQMVSKPSIPGLIAYMLNKKKKILRVFKPMAKEELC